jgi:hypothetical protein
MRNNSSLAYSFSLVVGDFLALVAAFAGAYVLRVSVSHKPISESIPAVTYLEIFLLVLPFWILLFALMGLYNSSIHEKRFVEAGRLLVGSFIGLLFEPAFFLQYRDYECFTGRKYPNVPRTYQPSARYQNQRL